MSPKILERAQSGLAKSKAKAKNRKENLLGIHFLFSSALIPFFFQGLEVATIFVMEGCLAGRFYLWGVHKLRWQDEVGKVEKI